MTAAREPTGAARGLSDGEQAAAPSATADAPSLEGRLRRWAARLKREIAALWLAYKRPETPWYAKLLAAATVAYALSPIDLIPDFVPVLGYLDDLIVLPLLVAGCLRLIPREVMEACRAQAAGLWRDGKPKRWYYAIPIVLLWAALLALAAHAVLTRS